MTKEQGLQLDAIAQRIEHAFGQELPVVGEEVLCGNDRAALDRVIDADSYQAYLHDFASRRIIRDYLINAVVLGFLPEDRLLDFQDQLATEEGRSLLSLHMLMSSVEEADSLPVGSDVTPLEPLQAEPGSPPHMTLVPR
tara:strand:- start:90744 stop:91160 length:417 start_codon:yes stop_codon:yes gene_type:complete